MLGRPNVSSCRCIVCDQCIMYRDVTYDRVKYIQCLNALALLED